MQPFSERLVSVIIAVYNGERYLDAAIESVLAQDYRPREIIVVDDGSTDGSAAVARRFAPAVRCFAQANGGVGSALNYGIKQATGEFLAFLDADDLWSHDKLTLQMAAFGGTGEPDMVFGHAQQFISPELMADRQAQISCPEEPMPGIVKGTLLIRRGDFLRVGPFDTTRRLGDFLDWYLRASEAGLRSMMLPDILLLRRLHDSNMGIREREARHDYVRILKASLDRRRQVTRVPEP